MIFLMQAKTISKVNLSSFFTFSFFIFLFNLFTGTSLGQNTTTKGSDYLNKATTQNKYNIKTKVSAKDKTSMMSFNSSDLNWTNVVKESDLKNPTWALEDNSYTWEPRDKSQYIKIPLRQKITINKNSPESVNKIEIEYRDLFPDNPVLPLLKIVTLDKKNLKKKVLHFQKQPFSEELLDISSTSWVKKNNLYLARRTFGIKLKPAWRYSQDSQHTVLQRQLDKNLRSFDTIDLVLDEELNENKVNKIICNFRILDSKSGREHIIPHAHLDPVFIKTRGKNIIRYKIDNFIQRTNLKIEKKSHSLYLKEIIIFLPGSTEEVVRMPLIKSILFLKQRNVLNSYMTDKEKIVNTLENSINLNRKNILPKLQGIKKNISVHYLQTRTLSRDSKRLTIKLPGMNNTINDGIHLMSIDLFIRPTNPNKKSGFRLQRARKIIRNNKTIKSIFSANTNNFSRWGGPFTNLSPSNKKFEYIKIKDFYPFENVNKNTPYESSKESRSGISIQTNDNSLFRILNDGKDIVADFWFLSKKSIATLNISKLDSFGKNQNENLELRIEGPLQINIMGNPITSAKNITDGNFLIKKNSSTTFKINPNQSLTEYNRSEIRGRLVLKNIKQYNQKNLNILETSESDSLKKNNLVHSRGITIQAKKPFKQWYSVVNGLNLEGKGKWIEIDWPTQTYLNNDTLFYLGISKGAELISSLDILPFNGEHPLKPISAIPNKSVRLNLSRQNIDRLKLRIKFHKDKPFNLVLREMTLFQTVAITEDQAVKFSEEWKTTRLIPSQLESTMPNEVSMDNENLNITVLPRRGHLETVRWRNIINKKAHSIGWLKAEYRISKSVHTFNKCWLELTWVGINQRVSQTICTRSSEGHILIPVNADYNEDLLKSIHWAAHIGYSPDLLTLPVSFDFKVGSIINNDITSGNYINFPLLKLRDKKIFPIPINYLINKKNLSNNMLDLGIHSMNLSTLDAKKIDILDHPFLHVDFISLEKIISNGKSADHSIWELPFIGSTTDGEFLVMSLIYKLVLLFVIILIVLWVSVKGRQITTHNWFTENTGAIKQYRRQLFILLVKIMPSHNQITLLNRLFGIALAGLASGMMISNNIYTEHIIFISTILLILGVFWNEFRLKNKNQRNSSLIILLISCAILLWFLWLLVYSDQLPSRFIAPLLVLVYFYIPWFCKFFSPLLNTQKKPASFWLAVAGTTYLIASIILIGGGSFKDFLNTLSMGHLAIIPYLGHIIQSIQKRVEYHFPGFAEIVYDSKENTYVTGFFIFVLLATLLRIIDLSILAEQFAIIAFYLLVAGITLKIKTFSKPKTTPQTYSNDL